jgi:hypothetical protein
MTDNLFAIYVYKYHSIRSTTTKIILLMFELKNDYKCQMGSKHVPKMKFKTCNSAVNLQLDKGQWVWTDGENCTPPCTQIQATDHF